MILKGLFGENSRKQQVGEFSRIDGVGIHLDSLMSGVLVVKMSSEFPISTGQIPIFPAFSE